MRKKGDFCAIFGIGLIARVSPPPSVHLTDAINEVCGWSLLDLLGVQPEVILMKIDR